MRTATAPLAVWGRHHSSSHLIRDVLVAPNDVQREIDPALAVPAT
jgi:hypothetical protein